MRRVLIVYQFATLGGVERAILNRALALKEERSEITMDLLFLRDYGGLRALAEAIQAWELDRHVRIVSNPRFADYENFSVIDTPEIFEYLPKKGRVLVECHASGFNSQRYLRLLPANVHSVAVPSISMVNRLGEQLDVPVRLLPNRMQKVQQGLTDGVWKRPTMFYVGRIEPGKNVAEALLIHAKAKQYVDELALLILTPTSDWSHVRDVSTKLGTLDSIFIHGALPFHKLRGFYARLDKNNSVFVSSSRHETWGLSAVEAIVYGIPPLLASNEGHREVAQNRERFLYQLGDVDGAVEKLKRLLPNRDDNLLELDILEEFHTRQVDTVSAFEELI